MDPAASRTEIEGAIFEAALSLDDTAARNEFLARSFHGDPEGLDRMKGLLEAAGDAASLFLEAREERDNLATELAGEIPDQEPEAWRAGSSPAEEIGATIGHYRLVRCLGEGGSGIVYEAEQTHPIERRVALKIIRIETDSVAARARFDIERQALAIMDHPNIAKVLDAGDVHRGSPYFVMELVEGESITSYCDREKLGIRTRIELFVTVCGAIQHAHSKRIVHRDIKPSNVLVTIQDHKPVRR